ncbi:hypothetical protein A2U01_0040687, partial [Trifolium medium]|nr:hypothetical protein [Trifolium medium]
RRLMARTVIEQAINPPEGGEWICSKDHVSVLCVGKCTADVAEQETCPTIVGPVGQKRVWA